MTDTNPPPPDEQPPPPSPAAQPPVTPAPPFNPAPPAAPPAAPPFSPPPAAPVYGQPPAYGQVPPYGAPPAGAYGYVPGPTDAQGRPLAEWWQRLVAIIIDGLILAIPFYIILAIAVGSGGVYRSSFVVGAFIVGIIFAAIELAYFAYLTGGEKGQTVGQMALGIAVRDQSTGGPIGTQRGAIRILVLAPGIAVSWIPIIGGLLSVLAFLYTIVAALSPLWDSRRQGFHDKVAKTDVIKVR